MNQLLEETLLRVSKSDAIDSGDINSAAELILSSVCQGLNVTRSGIWILDEDNESISCRMLIDKGNDLTNETLVLKRDQFPKYFQALDTERAIAAHDAEEDDSTNEFKEVYLQPLGISSMLDSPIRHKGKMVGIICTEHQGPKRVWGNDEIVFSGAMADLYGRAMSAKERQKYEQELQRTNANLEDMVKERTRDLEDTLQTLKEAQERLVESEKMAALGNLVAGVAHEVNTPLGIAVTSVSHCVAETNTIRKAFDEQTLGKDQFDDYLKEISSALSLTENNLQRASELVHNFKRTAADQSNLEKEKIDVSAYLKQMVTPFGPMLRKQGVGLLLKLEGEGVIKTFPGAISQIVTNLITNTLRHAFPDDFNAEKKVTIEYQCDSECAQISYKDNGVGLDEASLKKIFDPFYTTARNKGGTGLGMSIIYNLVTQKLKGQLDVKSKPGEGLSVQIELPLEI